ncbi:MAG: hypothetical protein HN700_10875 [Verrucomicrobia bacterium]|nr:hypothetical protein [Verrucomicrobiota bacterium]
MNNASIASVLACLSALLLGAATAAEKPLKIYILVGQSNMEGHGAISTLDYMGEDPTTVPMLKEIKTPGGELRECEKVWISYNGTRKGNLKAGYGATPAKIGPELTFGIVMQKHVDEPILIIKNAWGGKSLHTDFRSPSAGRYELSKETTEQWAKRPDGAHGIPKEADRPKWWADKDAATGHYYRLMMTQTKEVLKDIQSVYPGYDPKQGYELAGFVWFQGWNDMCAGETYYNGGQNPDAYKLYTQLMAHFIRDVRLELKAPAMPFVIGTIGVGGDKATGGIANLRKAMAATADIPAFQGNVVAVDTGQFWDFRMAALAGLKGKVDQRLRPGYMIGEDGRIEPRESNVPGWESIGLPVAQQVWRYASVEPNATKDVRSKKEKRRFRQITLPKELKDWYRPEFDDGTWQSGKGPVGKGVWKHRDFPLVRSNSTWGDGEFLLMRTTFDAKNLDYAKFRISIMAAQGFEVYLNGHKIHTYVWWRDNPEYRAIELGNEHVKHLKTGTNLLAVYAGCEYNRKTEEAFGAVDVMIEGITTKNLAYVNSTANKLRLMDKVCSREEGKIILGCSNAGYHYLGSAKMLGQIGKAFADALARRSP